MAKNDETTTIQELKTQAIHFSKVRGWQKHHSPKNLAVSIAIEAAELMEHFQWDDYGAKEKQEIAYELADVIIYCLEFSDSMDIDIATAVQNKLKEAAKKYPVEIFNPGNDRSEDYARIKKEYRNKKRKKI